MTVGSECPSSELALEPSRPLVTEGGHLVTGKAPRQTGSSVNAMGGWPHLDSFPEASEGSLLGPSALCSGSGVET